MNNLFNNSMFFNDQALKVLEMLEKNPDRKDLIEVYNNLINKVIEYELAYLKYQEEITKNFQDNETQKKQSYDEYCKNYEDNITKRIQSNDECCKNHGDNIIGKI